MITLDYQQIFACFPIPLALLDETGRLIFANEEFVALYERAQDTPCDQQSDVLSLGKLRSLFVTCLSQQQTSVGEFPIATPQGGISIVHATLAPLHFLRPSSPAAVLLLLEDISEKVRWEEQLLQVEKLSGMEELAATLAHELGNPLGIISSLLQYIQGHLPDNEFHEEIGLVMDQVERMHELLRILADITRPAEPRVAYERVDRIFAQILTFIATEAKRRDVRIKTDFALDLRPCLIDARQFKQVFLNLCKNALEAMPQGGTLTVAIRSARQEDGIEIDVSDTGVGIPPDDLDRIWKPFYSTKANGRGLGLSLCRREVERQGGRIHVRSVCGAGTTFTIFLPTSG